MKTVGRHLITATFAISSLFAARAATLSVGDPAPKLDVSKWVQGEPVKQFERDKAYIVEFWATWCGPCRVSIPHLNELHNKFKDKGIVVIGQDVWEQNTSAVAPFIKKMGEKMTYRVALDTDKGAMADTWMKAANQNGIPTAFVINKEGTIAWIGHPMTLKEGLLQSVIDGKYDTTKAAADYAKQQKVEEQMRGLWADYNSLRRKQQWEEAEAKLGEIEKADPEGSARIGTLKFQLALERKDYPGAWKIASDLLTAHPDEAMLQNEIAWQMATRKGLTDRNLDLAEKIAGHANKVTKGENAEILDTLARVLFLKGEKPQAIELEKKAVQYAEGDRKEEFQTVLDCYKKGELPKNQ